MVCLQDVNKISDMKRSNPQEDRKVFQSYIPECDFSVLSSWLEVAIVKITELHCDIRSTKVLQFRYTSQLLNVGKLLSWGHRMNI